ncbi:cystathionine gamma-synthase [Salibacteraceae bacterium]|nr:cystathionine gamma-synthase [Salibacteraceae bacterium]HAQ70178.1 cystathionine gamma-synthase [Flavobacteriales bacterium]MDB0002132.1 cystathionine gamma-synthase [Salibacteraceae bacterium]MDB4105238.1 cystathionine gamma-synthase [Salibacteraceae bacterium]MDB9709986.1 cystathionine gamma-synthase [Salibacteraceae bacterium]
MKFETKAIHAGIEPDSATGAIMTPIYQTSTYAQPRPGEHKGYEYSRTLNPTRHALEKNLSALENAKHGLAFGSGLAAIDACMRLLDPGDEVISTNDLYGGTYRLFTKVHERYGLKFHFAGMQNAGGIENLINENTKMIWVETPTNPTMNIIDIAAFAEVAKKHKLILVADNTFASPFLQNPLDLGADIVMHSVTKYIGGHSDVIMGFLALNDDVLREKLAFIQNSVGAVCGPMDAFLVLRGIKTLHLRMERHCENGAKVAHWLKAHPKVDKVHWPGFESHPNHAVAKSQMRDFGGMISFSLVGDNIDQAFDLISKMRVFTIAESLGGVESLAGHPATMTHSAIPKEERAKIGITDSLIRLSVGIEHIDDIIADLEQALS